MKNLFLKIINILILIISSTLFIYFVKLSAETKSLKHLFLFIFFTCLMLAELHYFFKDKAFPFQAIVIFGKVFPIALLILMDVIILKEKITYNKLIGFVFMFIGILFLIF